VPRIVQPAIGHAGRRPACDFASPTSGFSLIARITSSLGLGPSRPRKLVRQSLDGLDHASRVSVPVSVLVSFATVQQCS
jgi:hypothetical protein